MDPRHPRVPAEGDDVVPGLPAIDGADEPGLETSIELDVDDDAASALDDAGAELAGTLEEWADAEPSGGAEQDEAPAPLEADPTLAGGENERWTEGSDASEETPWQEPVVVEPLGSSIDRGEEGFDELVGHTGDALPGLPAAHVGDHDDEDADELDVSEASALETPSGDADLGAPLPVATMSIVWRGPPREAARSVAHHDGTLLTSAAGRGLWELASPPTVRALGCEGEVSALLTRGERLWLATDAGEIWTVDPGAAAARFGRPGTDDGSLGAIDLEAIGNVVVARTRGGALFRSQGDAWVGPIVARNVRRIRGSADWLVAVVGSATAPELLATRDARTFARLRTPEAEVAIEAARSGDLVAVASVSGGLWVSPDAGVTYAQVPSVADVEHVWVLASGVVLAATFHEASDQGRLVRIDGRGAVVLLDVGAEASARRLSGPGEHDGDGRVHAIAVSGTTLWAATGVGVFEIVMDDL